MPWLKEENRGRSLGMLETEAQRRRGVARFGVNVLMINRLVNHFRTSDTAKDNPRPGQRRVSTVY